MNNYEVIHGQNTHFVQAGNPWAACLDALRIESENGDIQKSSFVVTSPLTGEQEDITLADILNLQTLAANYNDKPISPRVDLDSWN